MPRRDVAEAAASGARRRGTRAAAAASDADARTPSLRAAPTEPSPTDAEEDR